ncbi:MAG: SpoIIE family protein phosphatase [Syntrophaceae bacterium]
MSKPQFENKQRGLAFRMSLLIVTSTTLIFIVAFGYDYYVSRNLIMDNIREESRQLAAGTILKIEAVLGNAERPARVMAKNLDDRYVPTDRILTVLEKMVAGNPEIFGSTVAFEPYGHDIQSYYFAPYYSRTKNGLKLSYLGGKSYNYFLMDWYKVPRETGRPAWSEPYYDEGGGNIVMSTFSAPFFKTARGNQTFSGVVTADISLEWLQDIISGLSISKNGYAFLISQNGVFVSHPRREWIMRESIFTIAKAANDPDLRETGRDMVRGGSGFIPMKSHFTGKKAWMYYAPVPLTNWTMGVIISDDELFSGLYSLNKAVLFIAAAGVCLLAAIVVYISNTITMPLRRLAAAAAEISRGSLDTPLPLPASRDEVGELISSFDNMRSSLKEYIADLKETTAAKERMESELKIGRTIQMSFLPQVFPPFPGRNEFDLFAKLEPAREVGGDLYGFSLVDENTLFFSIGDVSGKGVPAALFMAVTKTAMNAIIVPGIDPATILSRVNAELCRDNEEMMFCTMVCGLLDLQTGECLYSNAGHNPPLVVRTEAAGYRAEWLELPEGMLMGINDKVGYQTRKIHLNTGDMLLLYTDGVTEAMDENEKLYSEERLFSVAGTSGPASPEDLIAGVLKSVQDFCGNAPQSDDITIMVLRFKGSGRLPA